jgi:hypothetical protein
VRIQGRARGPSSPALVCDVALYAALQCFRPWCDAGGADERRVHGSPPSEALPGWRETSSARSSAEPVGRQPLEQSPGHRHRRPGAPQALDPGPAAALALARVLQEVGQRAGSILPCGGGDEHVS